MDVIYKVTYLPHLDSDLPKYYIGSKKNWFEGCNYMGSVASSKIFHYTDGLELKHWWKKKTKEEPNNFLFEIIESYEEKTPKELVLIEKEYQEKMGVLSCDYFNQSIATKGFVSGKNDENTRKKKSLSTKKYWDSPEGIEKRKRLSERNRNNKSQEMKEKWKTSEFRKKRESANITGRPKGSKNKNPVERTMKKIEVDGIVYNNAFEVSESFGIHPVNVRRRCRLEQYDNWRYV